MTRSLPFRSIALSLIAASLTACGTAAKAVEQAPQAPLDARYQVQATPMETQVAVIAQLPFLADAKLTAAQATRISTILTKAASQETAMSTEEVKIQKILMAPTIDMTALSTLIAAGLMRERGQALKMAAVLAAVRSELTETQRTIAADAVLTTRSMATPPTNQLPAGLTAAQKALFLAAMPTQVPQATQLKALSTLLRTGDVTAYTTAMAPKQTVTAQAMALAKAIASLTLAQRKALFTAPATPPTGANP